MSLRIQLQGRRANVLDDRGRLVGRLERVEAKRWKVKDLAGPLGVVDNFDEAISLMEAESNQGGSNGYAKD